MALQFDLGLYTFQTTLTLPLPQLRAQAQTEMKAVRAEAQQNRLVMKTARAKHGPSAVPGISK